MRFHSTLPRPGPGIAFAVVLAIGCASPAPADAAPDRVVSLGGSVTEILYALGLQDRIAAVDTTSRYPTDALQDHADVGYLRQLSPEGVLSVEPSLILSEADAGPAEAVALLEQASVPFLKAPEALDAEGIVAKIEFVAGSMDAQEEGRELAEAVKEDLATILAATGAIEEKAKVLFVLSAAGGRIMAAGEGTSAAAMIAMAGAENAVSGFTRYKPLSDEAILAAAPDVVVTMDGRAAMHPADDVLALPALAGTPAGRNRRLVTMDGLYLLGFGPRTAHAVRDLAAAVYPDRKLPDLPERPWVSEARAAAR